LTLNVTTPPPDFSALDRPDVLMVLFHPRREYGASERNPLEAATKIPGVKNLLIPVGDGIAVGARLHV
jgi:hypothetical protein